MIKVKNKEIELEVGEGEDVRKINYSDLIKICINAGKEGWSRNRIKQVDKIEEVIGDGSKDSYKFEDADLAYIKNKVMPFEWAVKHKDLAEFQDYIEEVK